MVASDSNDIIQKSACYKTTCHSYKFEQQGKMFNFTIISMERIWTLSRIHGRPRVRLDNPNPTRHGWHFIRNEYSTKCEINQTRLDLSYDIDYNY